MNTDNSAPQDPFLPNSGELREQAVAPTQEVVIQTSQLNKYFGDKHVLKDIDFEVHRREVVALIGPSGSGKSTLIRCLNGDIYCQGKHLNPNFSLKELSMVRRDVGMVFQNFNLFPHMTVIENVIQAPVLVRKTPKDQALVQGERLLAKVGLSEKKDVYPSQLSGGYCAGACYAATCLALR